MVHGIFYTLHDIKEWSLCGAHLQRVGSSEFFATWTLPRRPLQLEACRPCSSDPACAGFVLTRDGTCRFLASALRRTCRPMVCTRRTRTEAFVGGTSVTAGGTPSPAPVLPVVAAVTDAFDLSQVVARRIAVSRVGDALQVTHPIQRTECSLEITRGINRLLSKLEAPDALDVVSFVETHWNESAHTPIAASMTHRQLRQTPREYNNFRNVRRGEATWAVHDNNGICVYKDSTVRQMAWGVIWTI